MPAIFGQWETLHPDEIEAIVSAAPVAYLPLGTFEHHGWHLPICFDGIKAHRLCLLAAQRTGGVVMPTFYYGTGGGHTDFKWTIILPENVIRPVISATMERLVLFGFKVVVLVTGHYPHEQVQMVHDLAAEVGARFPQARFIGLTEPEITTPLPGDAYPGDHAAKYETSIAMALEPEWVQLGNLRSGRDPARAALPHTPRSPGSPILDPDQPLYAIYGEDPRLTASRGLGEQLVQEIVDRLVGLVGQPD
jgi:creatinine amidohydrolase